MSQSTKGFNVVRWKKSETPNLSNIAKQFRSEGLIPYQWDIRPNHNHPPRTDNAKKSLQVADGVLTATNLDTNQTVTLRAGDRLEVPVGLRYSLKVGAKGATCLEVTVREKPTKIG